ncbi:MAG: arsenate reductase (glutaredoxin) [Deltaproteobacteria bacterium]|nr:MAG: arsenate reductase (glutaredoxin) [Deltaproteobacteria bacterium]
MVRVKIYHNPRCSKSRQTLELLRERGFEIEVVPYLERPPSVAQLDAICRALGKEPLEIIRTKEKRFAELGLSKKDERSREAWLRLMVENPILIERPIVVHGEKAALGRPPENVLTILP